MAPRKPPSSGSRAVGDVETAIAAELKGLAAPSPGLSALALSLAREIDMPNSATSKSMCAKALMDALDKLRAFAPAVEEKDLVDEIAARRATRRAKTSG